MAYNFPRDNDAYPMYMPDGTEITSYDQGVAYNAAQEGGAPTNNILGPNDETGYGSISDAAAQNGGFANRQAYIEYLYPGGTWLDSQRYQLPEGMTRDSGPVNPPVANWNPADSLDFQLMPWLIAGGAGLGALAGAGATGAGTGGLLGAADTAAIDAASMGAGGNLGGAATGLADYGAVQAAAQAAGSAAAGEASSMLPALPSVPSIPSAPGTQPPAPVQDLTPSSPNYAPGLPGTNPTSLIPGIPNNVLSGAAQGIGGLLAANQQTDALRDIYGQTRADRLPALTAYNNALQNPDSWYQSAPAMGSVDAILRKLSVQGNPAANPGLLSQASAYNLGGYNDYLRTLSQGAFGTAGVEANLGSKAADAQGSGWEALGAGFGTATQNPMEDLAKRYGLSIGGMSFSPTRK